MQVPCISYYTYRIVIIHPQEELIEHYRTSIRTAETAAEGQKGRVAEMRPGMLGLLELV